MLSFKQQLTVRPGGSETFNSSGTFSMPPCIHYVVIAGTGGSGLPPVPGFPADPVFPVPPAFPALPAEPDPPVTAITT